MRKLYQSRMYDILVDDVKKVGSKWVYKLKFSDAPWTYQVLGDDVLEVTKTANKLEEIAIDFITKKSSEFYGEIPGVEVI